ncbi:MAG: hypothetical protein K1X55_10400 [Chitinophagales bacterium]|nr:hypothetical protein [Chitinophagales bacterium]
MVTSIFKSVLAGLFIGAALFLMPTFILGLLFCMFLFRIFGGRRARQRFTERRIAFAEHIRAMSEEEFSNFKMTKAPIYCHKKMNVEKQP